VGGLESEEEFGLGDMVDMSPDEVLEL